MSSGAGESSVSCAAELISPVAPTPTESCTCTSASPEDTGTGNWLPNVGWRVLGPVVPPAVGGGSMTNAPIWVHECQRKKLGRLACVSGVLPLAFWIKARASARDTVVMGIGIDGTVLPDG